MSGKRIFVSGGAGVIGSEMIPLLVSRGHTVYVGDLKSCPAEFPKSVRYRQGDLNEMILRELASFAPEVIIHLAATFERSTESDEFWEENFWHNVRLSHHLMSLAKELLSLRRVVFASSYLIYDQMRYQFNEPQESPVSLRETDPIMPRNLTGMAKLAHEIELRFLDESDSTRFSTVCARIFRGYGRNSRDVISRWIRALLAGEPITIYRSEGIFDYIYAKDTAEGLIRLADDESQTGILNLGTGRARRVQDIINILRKHFPEMQTHEEDSDIPYEASQADMVVYRKALNWEPEYSLEQAIPEIIAYENKKSAKKQRVTTLHLNILVTSASKKIPMIQAVKKSARKLDPAMRVIVGDANPHALARYVTDDFWQMPQTEETALDEILRGCKERQIATIIPSRDGELLFWARHRDLFADAGINIFISSAESVATCLDKLVFAQYGMAQELPFIPAALHPDEIGGGPYVVKERYGAGAKLIAINVERAAALEHGGKLTNPIYQPFVIGTEISVDAWLDRAHRVKGLVLRRREMVVGGESQVTTTFRDPDIETVLKEVLHGLGLSGSVVMQVLVDEQGGIHIIECNTRFGGASTLSIEVGLDVFYWSLLESQGQNLKDYPFERAAGEVRQVRVPADIYLHGSNF